MKVNLALLCTLCLCATAAGQDLPAEVSRLVDAQMTFVEGGSFTMGCTPEQVTCEADEHPAHRVQVGSFEITRPEVTQGLWEAVMGDNPSAFGDCPRCPVETVSWDDIQDFLDKLNAGGDGRKPVAERIGVGVRGPGGREAGGTRSRKRRLGSGRLVLREQRQPSAAGGTKACQRTGFVRHVGKRARMGAGLLARQLRRGAG